MGQNQSVEEPYHRRHYNVTDKKIQRQNSLSISSPNLLGDRRGALRRANTVHTGAMGRPSMSGPSSATPTSPTKLILSETSDSSSNSQNETGAGHQNSFLRLLPIETEPKYFDTSDEDDDTDTEDEYGDNYEQDNVEDMHYLSGQQRLDLSGSPVDLHVNSRSRTDTNGHLRESLDLQNAQKEEQEDLSYLSPVSGSIRALKRQSNTKKHSFEHGTIDHNHPSYFEGPMSNDMDDELHYHHSPQQRTSNNTNSTNTSPVPIKSAFLDAIREEANEENFKKKKTKNNSDLARASYETNRSRTGVDMIPGQQRNGLSSVNHATPSHTAIYQYGLDSNTSTSSEGVHPTDTRVAGQESTVAQLAISGPRTATPGIETGAGHGAQPTSLLSKQVGELDSRINEMEMLVTHKLVDIESKVQDLHEGKDATRTDNEASTEALPCFAEGNTPDASPSSTLVDRTVISELRSELQTMGVRYHELNDGMLTDLMSQMRDAKRALYYSSDADNLSQSDRHRIEAEIHAKLLSDIESRIQERVRAMEHISSRLEKCFDTMDGRLGALETMLAGGRRPRPESMYQILQQQYLQQQQKLQQEEQQKLERQQQRRGVKGRGSQYSATSALFAGARGDNMTAASPSLPSSMVSSATHRSASSSSSSIALPPPMPMRIRTNVARPAAIDTIHSAGPMLRSAVGTRTLERANTFHNIHGGGVANRYGQSMPNTPTNGIMAKRSLLANLGGTAKSNVPPHILSSGSKPPKKVPRPESYKELLHFWKAGGSMPDLLKGQPVPTTTTAATTESPVTSS
ncbi:hypothetical protein BG006_005773 [Podila minutissima]|uniref:Uncharacterized protein n=1 Tax=Podila minutissima TaxID=64525 RepID=A0A9P5SJY4_9FUNG|nr:hypothetical protein BG006_005773 [Podila minutissima]